MLLQENRKRPSIGLTPLIDVVFILLIFFMLIMQFKKYQQVSMDVVTESNAAEEQIYTSDIARVYLLENGDCLVRDKLTECDAIANQIKASSPETTLLEFEGQVTLERILMTYQSLLDEDIQVTLATEISSR